MYGLGVWAVGARKERGHEGRGGKARAVMQKRGGRDAAGAQATSSTAVTLPRRISQATRRMSAMPASARPRLLYFYTPLARWRWLTGTLTVFQPARCISAGR